MKLVTKTILFGLCYVFLAGINGVSCKHGYILTFPQELQIGAEEKFCIQLHNLTETVDLNLNMSCYGRSVQHQPKSFPPGESGCFVWRLPQSLTAGTCDLSIRGEDAAEDYSFTESKEVVVVDSHQITFIQTDKPLYKPKDTVKFRILTVTQDLMPLKTIIDSVKVDDPNDFHMKQWLSVKPQAGLVSLDYRLYDEPELGDWKITTVINGRRTIQTFSVQQYVLDKFQVDMKLPTSLTVATKTLQFEICARYTFGKPVAGTINASICLGNTETIWFCENNLRPCVNVQSKLDGCYSFSIETKLLDITERQFSLLCKPRLMVHASVTEGETGFTVEETQQGIGVWEERVKLKFVSDKYFKPFFPYVGKLYAWNADGSPAVDEKVTLTIGKLGIKKTLVTDTTGHVYFNLCNLTHSTPYFVLNAKTHDGENTNKKHYTIYPAQTKKHVKQWYSPTSSYIHLSTVYTGQRRCGENISIDVVYSLLPDINIETAVLQIMSRGNIVAHTNTLKDLSTSSPYIPRLKGPVFTPQIMPRGPHSIEDDDDANRLSPGPPGSDAHPAAGPPGSIVTPVMSTKEGKPMHPVAPLESLGLDEAMGKETKITSTEDLLSEITPPTLRHFSLRQYISGDMAPTMRVLVYMITDTGEMVADTLDIAVDYCYNNQVNMTFRQKSARPGEHVDLTLIASPGSLCSTNMVDKSIYLRGGLNLLQKSHVDDKLKAYDLTSDFINDWQYCSDVTVLPPDTNPGAGIWPIGSPGTDDSSENLHAPFSRKRRSIMQYYSNMYDALLAFKIAGLVVYTDLDLQTRPCLHDGDILNVPNLPGDPRGPIPGPGGELQGLEPTEEPVDTRDPVSSLRRHFPNTWLWELYEVPESGTVTFMETMPGTITEWIGNSVCSNEKSGLGVSNIARITGFQPFFVAVKLAYSVIRGETVHIEMMVFNYLKHCIAVQLNIVENGKFTLISMEDGGQLCICSEQSLSHTFQIQPNSLGEMSITFSAVLREHRISCDSNRAPPDYRNKQVTELVVKQLLVEAEGIQEETTKSQFICPQDYETGYQKTMSPELPTGILVPGSLRGWVSVIGDIMGPVFNGLEDLVLLPTGCGEQNMIRLAPNVAILQYLTVTRQLTEDIQIKTVDHLNKGYQQQLTFMHKDGSYSAFGKADNAGSAWLSAFVFKTLQQAINFIYIDRKQIQTKTWQFLIDQQGEDGCFVENGKVLSKYMMGGVIGSREHRKRALTAYVLVAMLESFKMMRERTPPFVALAVRCIQVDNLTDTYTHALIAYAMTLYKPKSRFTEILLSRLMDKAQIDGDTMFWKRENQPDILSGQGRAASAEIEITSYVLLAILTVDENAPISAVMPVIRWLTTQRNAFGGFASTQDTVVALQALSLFAQRIYGRGLDVDVNIADDHGSSKDVSVSHKNSIVLQQHDLINPQSDLHITARGEGCLLMQTTYKYNVENKLIADDVFTLSVTTPVTRETINNNCRQRTVHVCASYHGPDDESNMAVIAVKVVSGWTPVVTSLQNLVNSVEIGLKKYEMDKRYPDVVNFYFDQLYTTRLCFEFNILLEVEVSSQQPAIAKVFDYYESAFETTIFYKMTPCSEDRIDQVDISINRKSDLYIEENNQLTFDQNNRIQSESLLKQVEYSENIPAPMPGPHKNIPAPMPGPHENIPAPMPGPHENIPAPMPGPHENIPAPMPGPHENIPAPMPGPHENIPAPMSGPHENVSASMSGPHENVSAPMSGPHENVSAPMSGPHENVSASMSRRHEKVAASMSGPQCPQCVSTGTVNVLHDICRKQVWILQPGQDAGFSLWVIAADSISPELNIELPDNLDVCVHCRSFLLEKGERSIMFLEPYDMTDLGINIARTSTVILPWSESLQTSLQQLLQSCVA